MIAYHHTALGRAIWRELWMDDATGARHGH